MGCVKRIEQAGKWYEPVKVQYAKLADQLKNGASAQFESDEEPEETKKSSSSDQEEEADIDNNMKDEAEKKRKKKTKK